MACTLAFWVVACLKLNISSGPLQPAALHPVVRLQVSDGRLHSLASFEPSLFCLAHRLDLAPVDDVHARVGRFNLFAPVAQVHHDLLWLDLEVLQQDAALLHLGRQNMAIVGVARETSGNHQQALFVGDDHTNLDAKLVRLSGLAFADAFNPDTP